MSVTYYEGSYATTPTGLTAMAALKTAFDAAPPAGWSFVEEWTESSVTWHVYKCAASSSGLPNDFHVVFSDAQAGSANLCVMVCEGYDTTAHRMKRPAFTYNTSTTTPPANADGSVGDDDTLYRPVGTSSSVVRTAGTGATGLSVMPHMALGVASTDWAAFFYPDGMLFTIKSGSSLMHHYMGCFTSLVKDASVNDPMPVFMHGAGLTVSVSLNNTSGFTRSAMNAGLNGYHNMSITRWHNGVLGSGAPTSPLTIDKYAATNAIYLMPLMITRGSFSEDASSSALGKVRGRAKYMLWSGQSGTVGWGDTITVDGDVYQAVSTTAWALKSLGA